MPVHHIAIIHGIGKAERGYSRPLSDGIKAAYAKLEGRDNLVFHEVLWDDLVAVEQARLADVLRKGFGLAEAGAPVGFWGKFLGWPKRWINTLRTDVAATYVEDILSYRERGAYQLIHGRVGSVLDDIAKQGGGDLSIIAHSLGTVIASDYIYDAQKQGRALAGNIKLRHVFTLGSPLALFALQYGGVELFKSPVSLESPDGMWINIFDRDDPIAYPLRTLNDAYEQAVSADIRVNTGAFGVSHRGYFMSRQVHALIADCLAGRC